MKALIFLDIDGTLLDSNYQANSDDLPQLIASLERQGIVFGCNSHRSRHDILPILEQFGITGPTIAENGCFWFSKEAPEPHMLLDAQPLRPHLERLLPNLADTLGAQVHFTDTVALDPALREGRRIYLANRFREFTASIHVFERGERSAQAANVLAQALQGELGERYDISVSPVFQNVLVSPKGADKRTAIRALRAQFPGVVMGMVGDEMMDAQLSQDIEFFWTTNNATEEVKGLASRVASQPYTKGVYELLSDI